MLQWHAVYLFSDNFNQRLYYLTFSPWHYKLHKSDHSIFMSTPFPAHNTVPGIQDVCNKHLLCEGSGRINDAPVVFFAASVSFLCAWRLTKGRRTQAHRSVLTTPPGKQVASLGSITLQIHLCTCSLLGPRQARPCPAELSLSQQGLMRCFSLVLGMWDLGWGREDSLVWMNWEGVGPRISTARASSLSEVRTEHGHTGTQGGDRPGTRRVDL